MNEMQNNENEYDIDNQLADFTDRILNKKNTNVDENPFSQDPELRALEQTALRLKNIIPDEGPNKAVIQRMHQKISMHAQQQERKQSNEPESQQSQPKPPSQVASGAHSDQPPCTR